MVRFEEVKKSALKAWETLQHSSQPVVYVGTATCGRSAGSIEAMDSFRDETRKCGLECTIIEVGCIGLCYAEPIACIMKPGRPMVFYGAVTPELAAELVERLQNKNRHLRRQTHL